jgi:hypothetical protein
MSDQVVLLPTLLPPFFQLGAPGAPCGGRSACTDNVGCEIVRRDKGRTITAAAFRRAARPNDPAPCAGLTPVQFLRGLRAFGVKGYEYADHVIAQDVLAATDRGIVLVGVNYGAYPIRSECQVGGRTDLGFRGAHAISVWGRRKLAGRWFVWTRDPDHHSGATKPPYDRFDMRYLARAINALPGTPGGKGTRWATTFAVWRQED